MSNLIFHNPRYVKLIIICDFIWIFGLPNLIFSCYAIHHSMPYVFWTHMVSHVLLNFIPPFNMALHSFVLLQAKKNIQKTFKTNFGCAKYDVLVFNYQLRKTYAHVHISRSSFDRRYIKRQINFYHLLYLYMMYK